MSLEDLRLGLGDLTGAVKERRAAKVAAADKAKMQASQLDLANTISDSLPGQTLPGQIAAKGVASGQLDLNQASNIMDQFGDPEKALMWITSKISSETDPVRQQYLIQGLNQSMNQYNNVKSFQAKQQAYSKAYGTLSAQAAFGALPNQGKKGGGGGGGSGGAAPDGTKTGDKTAYTTDPELVDAKEVAVSWDGFDIQDFLTTNEDMVGTKDRATGFLKQPDFDKEAIGRVTDDLTKRAEAFLIKKNPMMASYGMEKYKADAIRQFRESIAIRGAEGVHQTGADGKTLIDKPFESKVMIPKSTLLPYVQSTETTQKSKNKRDVNVRLGAPKVSLSALASDAQRLLNPFGFSTTDNKPNKKGVTPMDEMLAK